VAEGEQGLDPLSGDFGTAGNLTVVGTYRSAEIAETDGELAVRVSEEPDRRELRERLRRVLTGKKGFTRSFPATSTSDAKLSHVATIKVLMKEFPVIRFSETSAGTGTAFPSSHDD
jgi:hypothetical protein